MPEYKAVDDPKRIEFYSIDSQKMEPTFHRSKKKKNIRRTKKCIVTVEVPVIKSRSNDLQT